jgi:hypothetical protein
MHVHSIPHEQGRKKPEVFIIWSDTGTAEMVWLPVNHTRFQNHTNTLRSLSERQAKQHNL